MAWTTDWSWQGNSIASYAMAYPQKICGPLSSFSSIPTTWTWRYVPTSTTIWTSLANLCFSYSTTSIVADVAYDLFLGSSSECVASGGHDFEVMIWLASYGGLLPIGNTGGPIGSFTYQGNSFDLYKGSNAAGSIGTVYSFMPKAPITSFSGDMKVFLDHLAGMDSQLAGSNLQSIQGGTEAQSGSATFTVSQFSISGGGS